MKANFEIKGQSYAVDLEQPIDISIPIKHGKENPNCFWAPYPWFDPYRAGSFVGSTKEGAPVNFYNVKFNPHGNGTHTECVGHIAKETFTINQCLKQFWFTADLVSIEPVTIENGDKIIQHSQLETAFANKENSAALVIRTLPNSSDKKVMLYSGTNPTYLEEAAMNWIVDKGYEHLLIDLPSVDREEDDGMLLSHHAFWNYPAFGNSASEEELDAVRNEQTITEMIFVPDDVYDGTYLLNIQIASFELDVSPSKPVLYRMDVL